VAARKKRVTDHVDRNDVLVPTENSITLWRKLVNADAQLHLYPDSGHGFLDEYHEHFARLINEFLDEPKAWAERA
jgi:pimeloyl-ACP methyl ester carboxylesterase